MAEAILGGGGAGKKKSLVQEELEAAMAERNALLKLKRKGRF